MSFTNKQKRSNGTMIDARRPENTRNGQSSDEKEVDKTMNICAISFLSTHQIICYRDVCLIIVFGWFRCNNNCSHVNHHPNTNVRCVSRGTVVNYMWFDLFIFEALFHFRFAIVTGRKIEISTVFES